MMVEIPAQEYGDLLVSAAIVDKLLPEVYRRIDASLGSSDKAVVIRLRQVLPAGYQHSLVKPKNKQ